MTLYLFTHFLKIVDFAFFIGWMVPTGLRHTGPAADDEHGSTTGEHAAANYGGGRSAEFVFSAAAGRATGDDEYFLPSATADSAATTNEWISSGD
jgi:hypothetical protein